MYAYLSKQQYTVANLSSTISVLNPGGTAIMINVLANLFQLIKYSGYLVLVYEVGTGNIFLPDAYIFLLNRSILDHSKA